MKLPKGEANPEMRRSIILAVNREAKNLFQSICRKEKSRAFMPGF
jgi:hypothetical protein